jgi:uncharacterized protein YjbJ (UPF0337 family)
MGKKNKGFEEKRNEVSEKIDEVKEVVQEQAGNIPDNPLEELSTKKDQVADLIEENYEGSWLSRNKGWVLIGTAFAAISTAVAYLFTRERDVTVEAS